MKKKYKNIVRFMFLIMIIIIATGCGNDVGEDEPSDNEEMSVYFVSQVDESLSPEKVFFDSKEVDTNEKRVQLAIQTLKKGPQATSLLPVIPNGITVESVELQDYSARIKLFGNYKDLTVQEQMIMRASFVRTLTNLTFINAVELVVNEEPLLSPDGEVIGPIYRDDIVLVQPDPKPTTNVQNIVLYFADDQGTGLVTENRRIKISSNIPLEKYIVEELIKGPQNKNNVYTVPPETKINDIKTKDGVCQIDLSLEFKSKHPGGSTGELLTIYSIVNSLTESSLKVKKVAFLIDGKKQTEYKGHLDLSALFERDESLIVGR